MTAASGKGVYFLRNSGRCASRLGHGAFKAHRADNDGCRARRAFDGGLDTHLLRWREPRLGQADKGREYASRDRVCGGGCVPAVFLKDSSDFTARKIKQNVPRAEARGFFMNFSPPSAHTLAAIWA